jgi:hypothetical protein
VVDGVKDGIDVFVVVRGSRADERRDHVTGRPPGAP